MRDAIVRLECERVLRVPPQGGIQVAEVDLDFVREAYQLRLIIEAEGLRHLARESDAQAIASVLDRTQAAIAELATSASAAAVERAVDAEIR